MGLAATDLVVNALSPDHHDSGMLRRDVLCGGGAAMLGSKLRTELPLYLGGEECFCTREWIVGEPQDFGYLKRKALADANVKVVFAETPAMLADHAFTTGRIPLATFEKVLAPTRMTVGTHDGIGCFPDKLPEEKRATHVIPDDFEHEIATCFNVKGRGLIVITSCGHRGVVNSVKRAIDISGIEKVHAVLGGMHLAPHKEDYVRETVAALKELSPDCVIPMHCSGEMFIDIVQKEMPGKFIRSYTGSRYIFGA